MKVSSPLHNRERSFSRIVTDLIPQKASLFRQATNNILELESPASVRTPRLRIKSLVPRKNSSALTSKKNTKIEKLRSGFCPDSKRNTEESACSKECKPKLSSLLGKDGFKAAEKSLRFFATFNKNHKSSNLNRSFESKRKDIEDLLEESFESPQLNTQSRQRRKSCECTDCGGVSKLEKNTQNYPNFPMNARELLNMTKKIFIDVQLLKNSDERSQKDCTRRNRKRLSFKSVMTPKSFTFQLKNRREGDTPTTFRHNPEVKTCSLIGTAKVLEEAEEGCQQGVEKKVVGSQMQVDSLADLSKSGQKRGKKDASRKETADETPKTEDGTSFEKNLEKSGKKVNVKKIVSVKQKEKSVQFGDYFGQSPRIQKIYGVQSLPNKGRSDVPSSLVLSSPLQMKSKSIAMIKVGEAVHNSKSSIENTVDLTQRLKSPRDMNINKKVKVIKGFPTEPSERLDSLEDFNIQANTYRDLLSKVESPRIKRDTKNEWIIKVYNNNKAKARC